VLRLDAGLPYRTALALAYLFAALGVLAKGLIGFVLPGAVLLAWILVRKRYRLIPALTANRHDSPVPRRGSALVPVDAEVVQQLLGLLLCLPSFQALRRDRLQQRAARSGSISR
jgi:hypothetical protein